MSRAPVCTLALLGLLAVGPAAALGEHCLQICGVDRLHRPQPTLCDQMRQAGAVLLGEVVRMPAGFRVLEVLKAKPGLKPPDSTPPGYALNSFDQATPGSRWLLFCEIAADGKLLPYRAFAAPAMPAYVKGLAQFSDDPVRRLAHCVGYLEHADREIAEDAYTELTRAGDRALRAAARAIPAERVAGWLRDERAGRYNDYALLLAYCGDARHADLLRRIASVPEKRLCTMTDRLLAGYVMLRPQQGWPFVQQVLRGPKESFLARYSALRAVRFFYDERTDVLPRADMVQALVPLLADAELGDMVMLDLRRWQRWELTDLVLRRWDRLAPNAHGSRRAVLYFALSSPRPQAAAFVARLRRTMPEYVADTEQLFRLLDNSLPRKGATD